MRTAYVDRDLSLRGMAQEAGCGMRTIARWMQIHDIPTDRTKIRRLHHTRSGPDMWSWHGDNIGYAQAHNRVRAAKGLPGDHNCAHCGRPAEQWAYDNADPNERMHVRKYTIAYSVDVEHYFPLCISCHIRFDYAARVSRNASDELAGEATTA